MAIWHSAFDFCACCTIQHIGLRLTRGRCSIIKHFQANTYVTPAVVDRTSGTRFAPSSWREKRFTPMDDWLRPESEEIVTIGQEILLFIALCLVLRVSGLVLDFCTKSSATVHRDAPQALLETQSPNGVTGMAASSGVNS
jgi:hypothetical protein